MECDKRTYESAKDAADHLSSLRQRHGRHKYSLYKCTFCGYYHIQTITKKILRPNRKDKYPIKIPPKVERKQKHKSKKRKK